MTSASTDTNYNSTLQHTTSRFGLSQQHLAALQAEQATPADLFENNFWDPTRSTPEALDFASQDLIRPSLMKSDGTGAITQFTPKPGRRSHQRESSLSSLGSVGPASPFTQTTYNPQIAISDSATDPFCEMYNNDTNVHNAGAYHMLSKPLDTFSGYQHLEAATPDMAYPAALPGQMNRHRTERSLLPAPEFSHLFNRSHPASVASSIAGDSPSTPSMGDIDLLDRRRGMRNIKPTTSDQRSRYRYAAAYGNVPKLDRTLTDVYGDELYNPSFAITSSSPAHPANASTTSNHLFSQRLSAANSQHLNAAHSPSSTASRGLSPFQATSPYAPPQLQDFDTSFATHQKIGHGSNEQHPAVIGAHTDTGIEPETPKTISPRDAMIEFTGVDGESNFSLFPEGSNGFDFDAYSKAMAQDTGSNHVHLTPAQESQGNQRNYDDMSIQNRIPQQYPFVSRAQENKDITPPPRLGSSGSSVSETRTDASGNRPTRVGAESGTYTCTYHGCTLRFDTPVQLQKHKREGHRQSHNLGGPPDNSLATSILNSQAGPHRCDRINPSTGKPCNTIFSRPYDLTRHEDTIHNERKHKVQCDLCTVEKTFSRADALTRHYRVCHPEAELPGKQRRRLV
ncbi:hypothetical protein MY8738_009425 [Beauveria namnaoensis]